VIPKTLQFTEHLDIVVLSAEQHEILIFFYAITQTRNNFTGGKHVILLSPPLSLLLLSAHLNKLLMMMTIMITIITITELQTGKRPPLFDFHGGTLWSRMPNINVL
jgi:hypothetical protein